MKKWVVVLFVSLALVVLVSPGLIGHIAERSVDENIRAGTIENADLAVSSLNFDRGWFTTEGQHRVELKDGPYAEQARELIGLPPGEPLPVLVITTRIDHGIFPVASMGREDGSLAPGLGDAISTIEVEMPDGKRVDLPGAINSSIGLTGSMRSAYELPAGAWAEAGEEIRWGAGRFAIETHPAGRHIAFQATLDELTVPGDDRPMRLDGLDIDGSQEPSGFGFAIGEVTASIESLQAQGSMLGPLAASGRGRIDAGKLRLDGALDLSADTLAAGPVRTRIDLTATGIDPLAFSRLLRRYRALTSVAGSGAPSLDRLEPQAQALLAAGLALDVRTLEVTLPGGTLEATLAVDVAENTADTESWSALLLATEASANLRVPEPLMETIVAMNPDVGAVVGLGYLKQDGDAWVTEIRYARGILTINGAPMAVPLPAP